MRDLTESVKNISDRLDIVKRYSSRINDELDNKIHINNVIVRHTEKPNIKLRSAFVKIGIVYIQS